MALDVCGLQTQQFGHFAIQYTAGTDCWWIRVETNTFSPFPTPLHSLLATVIWCTGNPNPPSLPIFCCSAHPHPPGSDTSVMTNHQFSPLWWWQCCQGNRHPGQQAPLATWEMTISENKVPEVCRLEGGEGVMMASHLQMGKGFTVTHRQWPDKLLLMHGLLTQLS